jgi:hypothetical protein
MTSLEVLLAIVGFTVTVLVVVGMILITPRGEVAVHDANARDPQGSDLSQAATSFTSNPDDHDRLASVPERCR